MFLKRNQVQDRGLHHLILKCPCCWRTRIVGDDLGGVPGHINYDYFGRRERNRSQDGWAICWECNLRLRDNEFKRDRQQHFTVFQTNRREPGATVPARIGKPKGGSPTVSGPGQGSLFQGRAAGGEPEEGLAGDHATSQG